METSIIFDYIENVRGVSPEKIIHVEDYIETHPDNAEHTTAVYSLYSVDFAEEKDVLYIQVASSSANIVVPANPDVMEEIFPDYVIHNTNDVSRTNGGGDNISNSPEDTRDATNSD
tara:strand:- start:191874 stop:192221 length:348 start_codon:yes stop_codon:yes gene_type:complete